MASTTRGREPRRREGGCPWRRLVVDDRELIKAMSWFDGFVVALANPSFLLTALGGSVVSLGGWGATIVWTISVLIGALHNNIYAEVAAMFPKLSGGVAVYAHEAWKRYTSFVGPIAAVGYWLGWSVVLSLNGAIVGFLLQAASSSSQHVRQHQPGLGHRQLLLQPAILIGAVAILVIWGANVLGVRPAVWTGYVDGRAAALPALRPHRRPLPHGRLELGTSQPHRLRELQHVRDEGLGDSLIYNDGWRLVITWLYLMCWSSYGFECCASFAPEYHDPERDTAKALRAAAVFGVFVYAPAADRRPRHVRRQERHVRQHADVLRRHVLEAARRHDGRHPRDHAVRRDRALDEHGHDGRVARPLRDLPGRHDDPLARASSTATTCPATR